MDLQITNNAVAQIRQLMSPDTATARCIDTTPDKPSFRDEPVSSPFPRKRPEALGIPSRVLADYLTALGDMPDMDMHSVTVLRHGAVAAEADFGAYSRKVWHISYSECKSVVGLAVGMLIDEGLLALDDKVVPIFGDRAPVLSKLTMKDLTVRHLLTMTSGVVFNEAASVTETDWVRGYLESMLLGTPGTKFNYNSMNTYMLSAIVCRITGVGLMEFLRPRLWEPLDITEVHWEKCPLGIEKGGWGLYMRPEDFAKIGQLVLQRGKWKGKQLVSAAWIDEATSAQSFPPESYGDYNYGYQIWVGRKQNSFLFSGMFGQNVIGWFDTDTLLVTNAGNDEMFQQSDFFPLTHAALGRDFGAPLPSDPGGVKELRRVIDSLRWHGRRAPRRVRRRLPPLPEPCAALDGADYRVTSSNAPSLGLMPLMSQALQNIYTAGLESLSFAVVNGEFVFTVHEADCAYPLAVGFDEPKYADLDFHGETHRVGVTGRFAQDEDDRDVLIVRVSFLETASSRHIRLYFAPDGKTLTGRWYETPGTAFLRAGLRDMMDDVIQHPVVSGLVEKKGGDFIDYKLRASFEPVITAQRE